MPAASPSTTPPAQRRRPLKRLAYDAPTMRPRCAHDEPTHTSNTSVEYIRLIHPSKYGRTFSFGIQRDATHDETANARHTCDHPRALRTYDPRALRTYEASMTHAPFMPTTVPAGHYTNTYTTCKSPQQYLHYLQITTLIPTLPASHYTNTYRYLQVKALDGPREGRLSRGGRSSSRWGR